MCCKGEVKMDKKIEIVNILENLNKKVNKDREGLKNINQKNPGPRDGLYTFIKGINNNIKAMEK